MKKIIAIFLFALVIRALLLGVWYQKGYGEKLSYDSLAYYNVGVSIFQGKGFQDQGLPTAHRPPIYPFFLGLFDKWGLYPLGVQIVQVVVGALSCVLLYLVARQIFNAQIGLLAAGIFSLDYMSLRQVIVILPESLFLFFLLVSFYFLFSSFRRQNARLLFLSGLFAGIGLLTKESLILFFPLLPVWMLFLKGSFKSRFLRALVFSLGILIPVSPWIVRNSLLYRQLVLITTGGGHTFYLGNNPSVAGDFGGNDWVWTTDLLEFPNLPGGFTPEADRFLSKKAWEYISNHPARFLSLMKMKIVNMWRPYPIDVSPLSKCWISLFYVPVVFLGLIGLALNWGRMRLIFPAAGIIFYIFCLHAVTIASIRYRFLAMPFLMIFAAFALVQIGAVVGRKLGITHFRKEASQCAAPCN